MKVKYICGSSVISKKTVGNYEFENAPNNNDSWDFRRFRPIFTTLLILQYSWEVEWKTLLQIPSYKIIRRWKKWGQQFWKNGKLKKRIRKSFCPFWSFWTVTIPTATSISIIFYRLVLIKQKRFAWALDGKTQDHCCGERWFRKPRFKY